jgi:hypothetical protein
MAYATGVTMKYEPCEEWEEPRSFEAFLASPQFVLHPWPERAVLLDESISRVTEQAAKQTKKPAGRK